MSALGSDRISVLAADVTTAASKEDRARAPLVPEIPRRELALSRRLAHTYTVIIHRQAALEDILTKHISIAISIWVRC